MARLRIEVEYVYIYEGLSGKKTKSHTLRGACRRRAKDLIDRQYKQKRRCVCGAKGKLFCEFDKRANLKACNQKKNQRIMKLAKRLTKTIKKAKKLHDKSKPSVEFIYKFDV